MKRVFIVYRNPLFAKGLGSLLSKTPGLEVVGMGSGGHAEESVWNEIRILEPDVVIVEEEDLNPFERVSDVAPAAQLVALSLNDDRIRVFQHRDVQGCGLEAIIAAITGGSDETAGPP